MICFALRILQSLLLSLIILLVTTMLIVLSSVFAFLFSSSNRLELDLLLLVCLEVEVSLWRLYWYCFYESEQDMWEMRRNGYKRCWRTVKPREQCLCPFTNNCRTNSDRDKVNLAWSPCYELLTCRYDICFHCFLAFSFQGSEVKQIPSHSLSPARKHTLTQAKACGSTPAW